MADSSGYTVGGTVQANGGLYIRRQADTDLLALCSRGTFAYVLYSRQVGKSSLIYYAAEQLSESGTRVVLIDLAGIGVRVTPDEWYLGQFFELEDRLALEVDLTAWWDAHSSLGVSQRMVAFFRDIVLQQVKEQIVVFVDEIDVTLNLPFADDFFAAIRSMYNTRPMSPEFNRLSFVLIGVATPAELSRDPRRNPFNLGETVRLDDFSFEEARPLAHEFHLPAEHAEQVLRWIIKWSGGHPYISQRICRAIADEKRDRWTETEVDKIVDKLIIKQAHTDSNLAFVRDMLAVRTPLGVDRFDLLSRYRDILRGESIQADERSPIDAHLKLSGIVKNETRGLKVRNLLYRTVFDENWIKEYLPRRTFKTLFRRRPK